MSRVIGEALEAAQLAEGLVDFDAFVDGDVDAVDVDGLDAEFRLLVVLAQAVHQVVAGGHALRERVLAEGRQRIAVELGGRLREIGKRLHEGALGFVDLVKHVSWSGVVAVQYSTL